MKDLTLQEFIKNSEEYAWSKHCVSNMKLSFLKKFIDDAFKKAELFDFLCIDPSERVKLNPNSEFSKLRITKTNDDGTESPLHGAALAALLEPQLEITRQMVYARYKELNARYKHDTVAITGIGANNIIIKAIAQFNEPVVFLTVRYQGVLSYHAYFKWVPNQLTDDLVEFTRRKVIEWVQLDWTEVNARFIEHIERPNKIRNSNFSGSFLRKPNELTHLNLELNDEYPFDQVKA